MTSLQPERLNPAVAQLVELTSAISKHNGTFSAGVSIGRELADHIRAAVRGLEDVSENPGVITHPSAVDSAENIFLSHHQFLTLIGFEITQNRERTLSQEMLLTSSTAPQKKTAVTEIEIDRIELSLVDEQLFVNFISSVNSTDVSSAPAQQALSYLAHTLDHEFRYEYVRACNGLSEKNIDQLATSLFNCASEFHRLGLKPQAAMLTFDAEHFIEGNLHEHLIAESARLKERHGFGPHLWHIDSSPEHFKQRWNLAIAALLKIEKNPTAAELAEDARAYLTSSIRSAREHFENISESDPANKYYRSIKDSMLAIIKKAERRLETTSS